MSNLLHENDELKKLLSQNMSYETANNQVALYFSGGIDSAIVLNVLLEKNIIPKLYALKMDDVESDDFLSFQEVSQSMNLINEIIPISENVSLSINREILISFGLPKRKKASLRVMSLFSYLVDNTKEDIIFTGLGSDAYYGLGRDFAIQCSLKGEKKPSLNSMKQFRQKTYNHYIEQYKAIKEYGKTNIIPKNNVLPKFANS